jgi:RNA polymerase sigma factor (sigma-70 family)
VGEDQLSFQALLARVAEGSREAVNQLVDLYGGHILRRVRQRLPDRLRSKFDSLDFVQDVWASFFAEVPPHDAFATPEHLISFLTAVAQHKVVGAVQKRLLTQKHDVNRETPLDGEGGALERLGLTATGPTASQVAVERELWEGLLKGLRPADRLILQLLKEGKTHAEVAAALRISEKTVQRTVNRAWQKLPR